MAFGARPRRVKVPFRERYAVSKAILGESLRLVARERSLWVFPFCSTLLFLLIIGGAIVVLQGFGLSDWATDTLGPDRLYLLAPVLFVVMLPIAYPVQVLMSVINTGFAYALHERLSGRRVPRGVAWSRAWTRLGTLARFNVVAMLVAGLLQFVGALLNKLRLVPYLGSFVQTMGLFGWAVASYFVIPIIAVEQESSALGAFRKSVGMARSQWGKSVAGIVTIGLAMLVPMLAAMFVIFGAMLFGLAFVDATGAGVPVELVIGIPLALLGLLLTASVVLSMTVHAAYQVGLFVYARTGRVAAPYSRRTLVDAWRPYQQPPA